MSEKPSDPQEKAGGMSTLDLVNMPPSIRRVTRIMLSKPRMTYQELCEAVEGLPEGKRLTRKELDEALETLLSMDWLTRTQEEGVVVYQIEVRRKAGSDVTRAGSRAGQRTRSSTISGLWDAVESEEDVTEKGAQADREMRTLHHPSPPETSRPPRRKRRGLFGLGRKEDTDEESS